MWFNGFAAVNGRIYFLLNSEPRARPGSAFVETDLDGAVIGRTELRARVTSFAAANSGQIAARVRDDDGTSKTLLWRDIASAPLVVENREMSGPVAFHEGKPVLVSKSKLVDFYPVPGQDSILLPHVPDPPEAIVVLPLPHDRTAVIGRMSGTLAVVEHRRFCGLSKWPHRRCKVVTRT
jgi:hypothetical protein